MSTPSPSGFHRLHALRMENDAVTFAMDEMRPRFDNLRLRHIEGTAPRAVVADNLFQTPPALAARLVALAEIQPGQSVLEPSAGLGRLLAEVMRRSPGHVTACDISPDCLRELYTGYPDAVLLQGDFLDREPAPFDRVVMNPPFRMRADIRHILHARQFLATGGVLAGLCLSTGHREKALRHLCDHWEVIPAGTFKGEGTNVETILFRMRN